jgi:hypothetical protein
MNKRWLIFGVIWLIWGASAFMIIAPSLGLANPVFPRPQPDYELTTMLISGVLFIIASLKTGIDYLTP